MKKTIALILTASMFASALFGCADIFDNTSDTTPQNPAQTTPNIEQTPESPENDVTTGNPQTPETPLEHFGYKENDEGGITIIGYDGTNAHVIVPKEINGKPVTRISGGAFEKCTTLTSIDLPDSITFIGIQTFAYCTSLKHIRIPANCKLGGETFIYSGLETVEFAEGVETIESSSFLYTQLKEVVLPDTVKFLGGQAFAGCTQLEKVVLNEGLEEIGSSAFAGCPKLAEIIIPKTVKKIDETVFRSCSSFSKITFEGNAPDSFLVSYAFTYDIPDYTIYYNSSAKGFTSPRWNGYKALPIGSTDSAKVYENFEYTENGNTVTIDKYLGSDKNVIVPEKINDKNVVKIALSAFMDNDTVETVLLPDTITEIGDRAFSGCDALSNINLPEELTSIKENAFVLCRKLSDITFPSTIKDLGNLAFAYCDNLKAVTIPSSVSSFGNSVFFDSGIETLVLEEGLSILGEDAFNGTDITEIIIPGSIKTIGDGAFASCKKLKSVVFNEGLISIGSSAFSGTAVTNISFPSTLKDVGEYAFSYCKIEILTLNSGLERIGNWAFQRNNFAEIVIPPSVTNITELAFENCKNLKKVMFEGNAPESYQDQDNLLYVKNYTIYYHADATGFESPIWCGYETEIW